MPWPKGKARGCLANPPDYLKGIERNAQDLISPRLGKRTVQTINQLETIEHVESGGHLIAEHYFPGEKAMAEAAYRIAKGHEVVRRSAVGQANSKRANDVRAWILANCSDLLANKAASRKALVLDIADRMRGARMDVPGDSSLFRHLAVLLGKKR